MSKRKVDKEMKKGAWSHEEDCLLIRSVASYESSRLKWKSVATEAGLKRYGKSCRMRWLNYLRPGLNRAHFSSDEDDLIIRLHNLLGNRWSLIAGRLPGRTDNQIKNYWNTHLSNVADSITAKCKDKQVMNDTVNNGQCVTLSGENSRENIGDVFNYDTELEEAAKKDGSKIWNFDWDFQACSSPTGDFPPLDELPHLQFDDSGYNFTFQL